MEFDTLSLPLYQMVELTTGCGFKDLGSGEWGVGSREQGVGSGDNLL